jgi:hypothetical protein
MSLIIIDIDTDNVDDDIDVEDIAIQINNLLLTIHNNSEVHFDCEITERYDTLTHTSPHTT